MLRTQGVETSVVLQSQLVQLPQEQALRQMDCLPDHLVLYDSLGRPVAMPWERVLAVAAGRVQLAQTETSKEQEMTGRDSRGHRRFKTVTVRKDVRAFKLLLELYVDGEPSRYRMEADNFQYAYLGDRLVMNDNHWNYVQVVRDVLRYATGASLNLGASVLRDDEDSMFEYASAYTFEKEVVWLFWHDFE